MSDRFWDPAVRGTDWEGRKPPVGALIAWNRRPLRVVEVRDQPPGDWDEKARDQWLEAGMPEPWHRAPFEVHVRPVGGGKRTMGIIQPWHYGWARPLPDHYAVCVHCGELAPCREITAQRQARQEMAAFERLANVLPGCCWGCSEPITARQRAVTFPGENLLMPTAGPDVTFHLRRTCFGAAARYEERWVTADPRRPRSLLTLRCAGSVIVHADGSAECFGAVDSDCPSTHAWHRGWSACYAQTHGCGQGCSPVGHPGCQQTPPPKDHPLLPENVTRDRSQETASKGGLFDAP